MIDVIKGGGGYRVGSQLGERGGTGNQVCGEKRVTMGDKIRGENLEELYSVVKPDWFLVWVSLPLSSRP